MAEYIEQCGGDFLRGLFQKDEAGTQFLNSYVRETLSPGERPFDVKFRLYCKPGVHNRLLKVDSSGAEVGDLLHFAKSEDKDVAVFPSVKFISEFKPAIEGLGGTLVVDDPRRVMKAFCIVVNAAKEYKNDPNRRDLVVEYRDMCTDRLSLSGSDLRDITT